LTRKYAFQVIYEEIYVLFLTVNTL